MNDERESLSRCDCGEQFHSHLILEAHKKNSCEIRYLSCVLCDERVSSCDMNAHLVQCGSKTTNCSKCLKYIRRSIYAYHLDNNCISFNENDATDNDHLISEKINFQIDDEMLIPCEIRDEQIQFSSHNSHAKTCSRNQNHRQQHFTTSRTSSNRSTYDQETNVSSNINEASGILTTSLGKMDIDSDKKLINTSKTDTSIRRENVVSILQETAVHVRDTLSRDYYSNEINHATEKLRFNILIVGAPRVGKSQLINALCNGENLAKTSSSLNSCTTTVECYVLEDNQKQSPGVQPFRIYFYDTPGIESWTNENGQEAMLKFIEEKDRVCLIYCASQGSFADLNQLHPVLDFCKTKQIYCALVCTNMWSNANRKIVLAEFEKELQFFGERVEKLFDQGDNRLPHRVILFGNGALCTMVNSIEYYDPEFSTEKKAVQGVDELIHSIMEKLDQEKLLGWCNAVLYRRSYWEKISQKVNGFYLANASPLSHMTTDQIAIHFVCRLFNTLTNRKK